MITGSENAIAGLGSQLSVSVEMGVIVVVASILVAHLLYVISGRVA